MKFLFDKSEKTFFASEVARGVRNEDIRNKTVGGISDILNKLLGLGLVKIELVETSRREKTKVYQISEKGKKVFEDKTFSVRESPKSYYSKLTQNSR